jgi:hypothetical protein
MGQDPGRVRPDPDRGPGLLQLSGHLDRLGQRDPEQATGVAEQGDNCSACPDFANSAATPATIAADAAYFQSQPAGLPFLLWEYWDNPTGWTGGNCQFTTGSPPDGTQAVNQWKANETLNGGGAN